MSKYELCLSPELHSFYENLMHNGNTIEKDFCWIKSTWQFAILFTSCASFTPENLSQVFPEIDFYPLKIIVYVDASLHTI